MSAKSDREARLSARQLSQLESANRLKSEFIANVSHELRTPVHAIIGYVELLTEGIYGPLAAEQEQTVQYIHDSAKDLLNLINNLLDLSRIESGRADLVLNSFDLRDLVAELCVRFKPVALAKGPRIEATIDAVDTRIQNDRGKLKHALTNLIEELLKSTEVGTLEIRVTPAPSCSLPQTDERSRRIQISIEVSGAHSPQDSLGENPASAVYRTKQLLALLSASISVESKGRDGTIVTIILPADFEVADAIDRLRETFNSSNHRRREDSSDRHHVLVVSDAFDAVRKFADRLDGEKYSVRIVPPGPDVLTLARTLCPLAILLDAADSASGFWSVFQELKSSTETNDIPTLFLGDELHEASRAPAPTTMTTNRAVVSGRVHSTGSTQNKQVLIADDDTGIREFLKCVLAEEGYRVSEAADGWEAVDKLNAIKPDLLILDLHMPELDGWDVMRYITRRPQFTDVEVLVISGEIIGTNEENAITANASGFMRKADFSVDTVVDTVADLLEVS